MTYLFAQLVELVFCAPQASALTICRKNYVKSLAFMRKPRAWKVNCMFEYIRVSNMICSGESGLGNVNRVIQAGFYLGCNNNQCE